jgi:ABC-type phosphate/phosphonate transport system permease subunit
MSVSLSRLRLKSHVLNFFGLKNLMKWNEKGVYPTFFETLFYIIRALRMAYFTAVFVHYLKRYEHFNSWIRPFFIRSFRTFLKIIPKTANDMLFYSLQLCFYS